MDRSSASFLSSLSSSSSAGGGAPVHEVLVLDMDTLWRQLFDVHKGMDAWYWAAFGHTLRSKWRPR